MLFPKHKKIIDILREDINFILVFNPFKSSFGIHPQKNKQFTQEEIGYIITGFNRLEFRAIRINRTSIFFEVDDLYYNIKISFFKKEKCDFQDLKKIFKNNTEKEIKDKINLLIKDDVIEKIEEDLFKLKILKS